ncbi:MAG TPA: hypothetical protein VF398_10775 [bacterium]|jgi:phage shock protein A
MELRDVITIGGIVTSAVGSYAAAMTRTRLKLQHLEDIKADRDELSQFVSGIKDDLHSLDRKITEMDTKISLLLIKNCPVEHSPTAST